MKAHFLFSLFFITIPLACCEKKELIKASEWTEWAIKVYPSYQAQENDVDRTRQVTRTWLAKARKMKQKRAEGKADKLTATMNG